LQLGFQAVKEGSVSLGLSPAIFSVHTLKPLDGERVASILQEYPKVVILEESTGFGSLGTEVKEIAWNLQAKCEIHSIHLQDKFIKCYGTKEQLMAAHDVHLERVKAVLGGSEKGAE